jgi:hypothetical protein
MGADMSILWAMLKFTNPVTGILMTAAQWAMKLVGAFVRGVFSFMQNPLEVFAVACLALIAFAFGAVSGIQWDAHKVREAKLELATVYEGMQKKDRLDAQKAAEAVMARRAAEAAELARQANTAKLNPLTPLVSPDSTAAVAVGPTPAGVRKPANKVRRRECEQSLFGCF